MNLLLKKKCCCGCPCPGDPCTYCGDCTPGAIRVTLSEIGVCSPSCTACNNGYGRMDNWSATSPVGEHILTQSLIYPCLWEKLGVGSYSIDLDSNDTNCTALTTHIGAWDIHLWKYNATQWNLDIVGEYVEGLWPIILFSGYASGASGTCLNPPNVTNLMDSLLAWWNSNVTACACEASASDNGWYAIGDGTGGASFEICES